MPVIHWTDEALKAAEFARSGLRPVFSPSEIRDAIDAAIAVQFSGQDAKTVEQALIRHAQEILNVDLADKTHDR